MECEKHSSPKSWTDNKNKLKDLKQFCILRYKKVCVFVFKFLDFWTDICCNKTNHREQSVIFASLITWN